MSQINIQDLIYKVELLTTISKIDEHYGTDICTDVSIYPAQLELNIEEVKSRWNKQYPNYEFEPEYINLTQDELSQPVFQIDGHKSIYTIHDKDSQLKKQYTIINDDRFTILKLITDLNDFVKYCYDINHGHINIDSDFIGSVEDVYCEFQLQVIKHNIYLTYTR